jgi:DNA-binding transcriptional ArsR family regulator
MSLAEPERDENVVGAAAGPDFGQLFELIVDIADRLNKLETGSPMSWVSAPEPKLNRVPRSPLPDPRLLRRIIRQRQLRARFFDGDLFADPAWDMLLDLTAARAEHKRVSVTSLCIASGVPPTTALRWIGQLTGAGLIERVEDDRDRRRAFLVLTDHAANQMAQYFLELGGDAARSV